MSRGAAVASERASSARPIGRLAIDPTSSRPMTTTNDRMTASRSRRHDVEWTRIGGPTVSRTIRSTTSTGCSVAPELRGARRCGPSGPVSCDPVAVQPDDEDLGLDRAVDVPADRLAASPRPRQRAPSRVDPAAAARALGAVGLRRPTGSGAGGTSGSSVCDSQPGPDDPLHLELDDAGPSRPGGRPPAGARPRSWRGPRCPAPRPGSRPRGCRAGRSGRAGTARSASGPSCARP